MVTNSKWILSADLAVYRSPTRSCKKQWWSKKIVLDGSSALVEQESDKSVMYEIWAILINDVCSGRTYNGK